MRALISRVVHTHHEVPSLCQRWDDVKAEIEVLKQKWDSDRITITTEGSIIRTSDETIKAIHSWAASNRMLWTSHLQQEMTEHCFKEYGRGALQHLAALEVLDERLLAAHCNSLLPGEMKLMVDGGVRIAHCPVTQLWSAQRGAPFIGMGGSWTAGRFRGGRSLDQ